MLYDDGKIDELEYQIYNIGLVIHFRFSRY